jgi:hypothetical protein
MNMQILFLVFFFPFSIFELFLMCFQEHSFIMKHVILGLWGRLTLYKYISCWLITEGVCIMSGKCNCILEAFSWKRYDIVLYYYSFFSFQVLHTMAMMRKVLQNGMVVPMSGYRFLKGVQSSTTTLCHSIQTQTTG